MGDRPAHAPRAPAGRARRPSASPPTKIVSVAFWAPSLPPETGASIIAMSCSRRRAAKPQLPDGAMVEQSMTSVPGTGAGDDAVRPEQDGLDVRRVRDADDDDVRLARRRPAGETARTMPRSAESRARSAVRFQPVTLNPARARFAAIAAPIVPSPRKATRVGSVIRSGLVGARTRRWLGGGGWRRRGALGGGFAGGRGSGGCVAATAACRGGPASAACRRPSSAPGARHRGGRAGRSRSTAGAGSRCRCRDRPRPAAAMATGREPSATGSVPPPRRPRPGRPRSGSRW